MAKASSATAVSRMGVALGLASTVALVLLFVGRGIAGVEPPALASTIGLEVEGLAGGAAASESGLQVGDRVLGWSTGASGNDSDAVVLSTAWQWRALELDQRALDRASFLVLSSGRHRVVRGAPAYSRVVVRPLLPPELAALYADALASAPSDPQVAADRLVELAREAAARSLPEVAVWARWRAAQVLRRGGELDAAVEALVDLAGETDDPLAERLLRLEIGESLLAADRLDEARRSLESAVEADAGPLVRAVGLERLGDVHWRARRIESAHETYRAAITAYRSRGPGSLGEARVLTQLGAIALVRDDLEAAERRLEEGLVVRRRHPHGAVETIDSLTGLSRVAQRLGDFDRARASLEAALLVVAETPASRSKTGLLNLGIASLEQRRGDFALAEVAVRRAIDFFAEHQPRSFWHANSLGVASEIALNAAELDLAADYSRRALAMRRAIAPRSKPTSINLLQLARIESRRGDLEAATSYVKQALEALPPKNEQQEARIFLELGRHAAMGGDPVAAEALLRRALGLLEGLPDRGPLPGTLRSLGETLAARGRSDEARRLFERALAQVDAVGERLEEAAEVRHQLSLLEAAEGDLEAALAFAFEALDDLEAQVGRLRPSDDSRGDFQGRFSFLYRNAIRLSIELGRPEQAFDLTERYRARRFLARLAERDLRFDVDLPPDLDSQRRINSGRIAQLEERRRGSAGRRAGAGRRTEEIDRELRRLYREREEIAAQVRAVSAKLADLKYPTPLVYDRVRAALDGGTVLLSYSVGRETSDLFVVRPDADLQVVSLEIGTDRLQSAIDSFRELIQQTRPDRPTALPQLPRLRHASRQLYRDLLAPAESYFASAERLLILPDGPLHRLPFAALRVSSPEGERHLGGWKALRFALSATVAETLERRTSRAGEPVDRSVTLVAFGDPQLDLGSAGGADLRLASLDLRAALRSGVGLGPLPNARREVEELLSLAEQDGLAFLGAEATEERAKSASPRARLLHFATHGVVDHGFPLNSGLVFAGFGGAGRRAGDGILQAWEIFEELRLSSDLVVLSSCETGLGGEAGSEGLIGLTRAFQYAGAASVLASLWKVSDEATPELMVRFYRELFAGRAKDDALRRAQAELAASGGPLAAPYHWAAFQLYGDWRPVFGSGSPSTTRSKRSTGSAMSPPDG